MNETVTVRVSVVMCTYNGENYLREQLDSILLQNYPIYELIIQDDGSTDATCEIVAEYCIRYPIIDFCRNETQRGVAANFITAIERSSGEYIALADQDDIWNLDKLSTLVSSILTNRVAFVYSDYNLIDRMGRPIIPPEQLMQSKRTPRTLFQLLFNGCNIIGCTTLFDASLKKLIHPYPRHYVLHDYWIALLAYNNGGIFFCDRSLIQYRQHESNVTASLRGGGRRKSNMRYFFNKASDLWIVLCSRYKIGFRFYIGVLLFIQIVLSVTGISYFKKQLLGLMHKG